MERNLMSREPWNTGTGKAGEDMPRKSLDIRFTDYPVKRERCFAPFPASGEDGRGQSPQFGSRDGVPCGFLGQRPKPSESLLHSPTFN